ncbi:YbbR-like domain-containing protein [Tenacibaculum sp. 190524A02b]|uniref:YbbR-like domain-containing protein n=1 Tax=Tenacibaculum vairaonense TaxID=3137860 RepID=UPI0031FAE187
MKKAINIPKTFIGFLIASLLFWLLMNLSKTYTTEISVPVSYTNLGLDKVLLEKPQEKLALQVKGTGFKLINIGFSNHQINFDLKNLKKTSKNNYYLLSNSFSNQIQKQLKSGISLITSLQDTLKFKIGNLSTKKVPLSPDLNINYKKGYNIASPIKITPDSIALSGSTEALNEIHNVLTEKVNLVDLDANFSKKVNLILPNTNIKSKQKEAVITFKVEKFTEGKLTIPIIIKNSPKSEKINIFPKTVDITYKIGLKNFSKVNKKSFSVYCDYKQSLNNNLTYLVPILESKTDLVSSIRMTPNKIDFLIHK